MKLIIQIPCLNEEDQLPVALADLPRHVDGFDTVEWLVIDDGSTDRTIEVAREHGVEHIVKMPQNRGLAAAFQAGMDAALKLGADVIVNTDADNQYDASAIPMLVAPILRGEADLVVGDRDVRSVEEFSGLKIRMQLMGSWVVRKASDTQVPDVTSGFRAYSKESAIQLTVVNRYTYTLESLIQAGKMNSAVASIPVKTNPKMRESRLFGSMWGYMRRNALVITRAFAANEPILFFGTIGGVLLFMSLIAFLPFLNGWIINGDRSGHVQSIILGAILFMAAIQVFVLAFVADLIAGHRLVTQRVFERVRRLEIESGVEPSHYLRGAPAADTTRPDAPASQPTTSLDRAPTSAHASSPVGP